MSDFWKCDGCGEIIKGHFRMGVKNKDGKAVYVVECPTCGHSGYKNDEDLEHSYKGVKKRWINPEKELEGLTENQRLRQHGFHDLANKHTDTINYKNDPRYYLNTDDDELRKKKPSKAVKRKPTKKSVKKVVKKCKCK